MDDEAAAFAFVYGFLFGAMFVVALLGAVFEPVVGR